MSIDFYVNKDYINAFKFTRKKNVYKLVVGTLPVSIDKGGVCLSRTSFFYHNSLNKKTANPWCNEHRKAKLKKAEG
jgi:hypothetical protein